ncbi:MAG TPA: host attachment protein [Longimicrobiales bacterium]
MLPLENEIRELEHFDCAGARALSLYLNTDPSRASGWNLSAQINYLIRPTLSRLEDDPEAYTAFRRDVDAALATLKFQPPPRALAVFVCTPRLLYAVPLRFAVVPQVHWDDHLHLEPLLAELDEHERALVVLLDQEHARFFRIFLGRIEQLADFTDDVPERHREGGYSQEKHGGRQGWTVRMGYNSATIQRHQEWHVRKHLDHVIAKLVEIERASPAERIIVSATPELFAEFVHLVPRRWRRLVENELHVPLTATPAEVLAAAMIVQERGERRAESELVHNLFELDAEHAARGAAAVAEAISNQEALTFVYAKDAQLSGAFCASCGWLMPDPAQATCTRCHAEATHTDDLIDLFIDRVLQQNGKIEEVRGAAATQLKEAEGLAVVRRYTSSVATV